MVDPSLQIIDSIHVGVLRRDRAEQDDFTFGHEAKRFEAAGAVAVVFEWDTLLVESIEQFLGDGGIGAFAVPLGHGLPVFGRIVRFYDGLVLFSSAGVGCLKRFRTTGWSA